MSKYKKSGSGSGSGSGLTGFKNLQDEQELLEPIYAKSYSSLNPDFPDADTFLLTIR